MSFLGLTAAVLVCIIYEIPMETALKQVGVVADAVLKRTGFCGLQDVGAEGSGELRRCFGRNVDLNSHLNHAHIGLRSAVDCFMNFD